MGMWHRVFGRSDTEVTRETLEAHLASTGVPIACEFTSDEHGWLRAELRFAATTPLHLERFRADEEGIRAELNSWAAFLETCDYDPNHAALMERVIQTRQLFTLRRPVDHADEVLVERLCVGLCSYLASATDGIWQCDDEGFFAADGALLLKEY
jgi:hypothetical protein